MSLFLLFLFLVFVVFGVPIAIAFGIASISTMLLFTDLPMSIMTQSMFTSMNSFIMVSVPLFILSGSFMDEGGCARRIYNFANASIGWLYGGLGHVAILSNMIFAAMSGSSIAAMASIGKMSINALEEKGYPKDYATAVALSSSMLAVIIPPSILMVVAASVANLSVGKVLFAGAIPGFLISVAFMIYNFIYCKKHNIGEKAPFSMKTLIKQFVIAIPALLVPVILLVGMFSGYYTPTEAAVIAVVYTICISLFVYKDIDIKRIPTIICKNAKDTASILFIAITAKPAALIFELDGLPSIIGTAIAAVSTNPIIVMLLLFLFLVFVGMFMDATAAIYILIPVLLPVAVSLGIDPIYFTVFLVITLAFGLITPPVGVCLYAAANVTGLKLETIVKASLPWLCLIAVLIISFIFFPWIITKPIEIFFN